ncbi:hypothetical protein DDP54_00320 (plasmid) [Cellulomonas sp. WB94]|uniref:hypothetical protein n=1 Tax=Cellulomonas sp. WB94 TaxID=2173174 RepID=UPI000D56CA56|nr:hypothetical protein [Cellulomonas sp. WB94]PVU84337.1 hypothetical protein DDP54_00320 [Cellulomonas sp. WB94]
MTAMTPRPTVPAGHAFEHGGDIARPGQRRALSWALGVNIALLVVEVIGGILFGSLALLADAAHLVSAPKPRVPTYATPSWVRCTRPCPVACSSWR